MSARKVLGDMRYDDPLLPQEKINKGNKLTLKILKVMFHITDTFSMPYCRYFFLFEI